jgi:hypothetical protein
VNEIKPIIYRIAVAEIVARGRARTPGYAETIFAAGRPDGDGMHWLVPLEKLRLIWREHGAPGLDLEHGGGCEGCGD